MKTQSYMLLLAIVVALAAAGCGRAETPAPTATPVPTETPAPTATPVPTQVPEVHQGQLLVEGRCGGCHELEVVESARFTPAAWKATVDRMVMNGAQLDEEEQALVIEYLAETYAKE